MTPAAQFAVTLAGSALALVLIGLVLRWDERRKQRKGDTEGD